MDVFNIIAGVSSIVGLVISIISLIKVTNIDKQVNNKNIVKSKDLHNSGTLIVGGDNNGR